MASTRYCAKCLTTFTEDPERCPNLTCSAAKPKKGWGDLLAAGDTLDRHYYIVKPLAVGGAGLTYLAREVDASGTPQPPDLAIKVLYTQRDAGPFLRRLSNEAQILQELAHPHIVECRGFVHRTGHAPYLVTLFEHGGSLSGHLEQHGPLAPKVAMGILKQILQALDTAHQRGVVHRDLKPDNVLLAQPVDKDTVPHIKVTDFGIAKMSGGMGQGLTRVGAFVGTPEYAAPEQFVGQAPSPATDVFSAGGLVFHLVSGHVPVHFTQRLDIDHSHDELLQQIPPQLPPCEDAEGRIVLQDCIDNMMRPQPQDRWTLQQVLARLAGQAVAPAKRTDGPEPLASNTPPVVRGDGTLDLRSQETFGGDDWTGSPPRRPGTVDSMPANRTVDAPSPTQWVPGPPSKAAPPPPPPPAAQPPAPAPAAPMPAAAAPPPAASPHRIPTPAPRPRRTPSGSSTAVSLIGGMTSALLIIGLTTLGALIVLGAGAGAFGWFSPPPLPVTIVELDPLALKSAAAAPGAASGAVDITTTKDAALAKERDGILVALRDKIGPSVSKKCTPQARKAAVELMIETSGKVSSATVIDGASGTTKTCIEKELWGVKLPRTSTGAVHVLANVPL